MRRIVDTSVRPLSSLRYAQDERFQCPFVLSVTCKGEVEAWAASPQMI